MSEFDFDERWLEPGAVVMVDPVTTGALLREVQRLRKLAIRSVCCDEWGFGVPKCNDCPKAPSTKHQRSR